MTIPTTAAELKFDGRALINGERVWAQSGQAFDCISPVDGRLLTPVARLMAQVFIAIGLEWLMSTQPGLATSLMSLQKPSSA